MKLLIVEDEELIMNALCKGFRKMGYEVEVAEDGEAALDLYFSHVYGAVILDLNLPKLDGLEVLRAIRLDSQEVPVLILSARSEVEDKIAGLDEGANDYLAKPFHFKELEARVRALLRRSFRTVEAVIEVGEVRVDTASRRVFVKGEEVSLARKEYGILEYLMLRRGSVVSALELVEHIWESDSEDRFNSFKVRLSALRKKLPVGVIQTQRGGGYFVA